MSDPLYPTLASCIAALETHGATLGDLHLMLTKLREASDLLDERARLMVAFDADLAAMRERAEIAEGTVAELEAAAVRRAARDHGVPPRVRTEADMRENEPLDDRLRRVEGELRASFDAQAAAGWPSPVTTSLATRVHEANATADHLQEELYNAVVEACGNTPSDESEIRTDQYDNSIEVWGVGAIDLDQVAAALKAHGFERVWLHLHTDRGTCGCPCR